MEQQEEKLRRDLKAAEDALKLHLVVPSEFYEPIDLYQPETNLSAVVESILPCSWRVVRSGIWYQVLPPKIHLPIQGWKIHVSTTAANADSILREVAAICVEEDVAFKFACDISMLILLNSRWWDRGAAGKFITIYPRSEDQFKLLLEELYSKLERFDGPYILSDRRYKNCKVLYYRYGGITPLDYIRPDGTRVSIIMSPDGNKVPDSRIPYFELPTWVQEPFAKDEQIDDETPSLKNGRYLIIEVLAFTNAGGVYGALDAETGEAVVIKEARPFTDFDLSGTDAVKLRENEWCLLNRVCFTSVGAGRLLDGSGWRQR